MQSSNAPSPIGSKELTDLKEVMELEALACKKAIHYTQTFTDPALQNMAQHLVDHHKAHFEALCKHLQCV